MGVRDQLREEILSHFSGTDPTYDLVLPYLDAVVHEILQIYPPILQAAEDDVLPLSEPVRTASGKIINNISVAKGTLVSINVASINRSTHFWGPDAKVFNPARWLGEDGITGKAKEIQGHRHLLTFISGLRTCLVKNFAITELKASLKPPCRFGNFAFEMVDPNAKVEMARGLLPHSRLAGEEECSVPLRVRRVE
ncbi:cytochrome P450 [Hygrophoropsis aurantiaca]|uniref:Cytochrome P450 n=1 Tax=Hygrophoropsis aurantiaca TaxID=72124 RepID=A0ACB8ATG1_9AGAM|nr:cytochrome P450 [Hygrophoropsis aurantiaca]